MKYNIEGLNKLVKQINDFVIEAGFNDAEAPLRFVLIHSEISEAFDAFRNDRYADRKGFEKSMEAIKNHSKKEQLVKEQFEEKIKDSMEDEIADSIIRLFDFCGKYDIDIEYHIQRKMEYNATRGYKYGGKKF